ncbi:MAG: hypothetical protein ACI4PH_02945 [Faecousia sp.]
MTSYIQEIKSYLKISSNMLDRSQFDSLIELLWYYYTLYYPVNCEAMDEAFQSLEPIFRTLSYKRQRKIKNAMTGMCAKQERTAFMEGIRVGAMLILEILE